MSRIMWHSVMPTVTIYRNHQTCLTLNLLTWTKWWAPASDSKWQMGFNSAFKGLITLNYHFSESYVNAVMKVKGRRYPRLCVFAFECFYFFMGGLPARPQKPPFLEDQFVSLSLAFSLIYLNETIYIHTDLNIQIRDLWQ